MVKGEQKVGAIRFGDHMPYGKARDDVRNAIRQRRPVAKFTHKDVWGWLGEENRNAWTYFYGGQAKAKTRLAATLISIYKKVPYEEFPLTKVPRRAATYVYNDPEAHAMWDKPEPKPKPKPEPEPKPEPKPEQVKTKAKLIRMPETFNGEYIHVGYDNNGVPIFLNTKNEVGWLVFRKMGRS